MHMGVDVIAAAGYYLIALGWTALCVGGLVMLLFRRTRWLGASLLAAGVIWAGVLTMIDRSYAASYQRVIEHFDEVKIGMTPQQVSDLIGKPVDSLSDEWWYRRQRCFSAPAIGDESSPGWMGWCVRPFHHSPDGPAWQTTPTQSYVVMYGDDGRVMFKHAPQEGRYGDDD